MTRPEVTLFAETAAPVEWALAAHLGGGGRAHKLWTHARPFSDAALRLFDMPPETPIAALRYLGDGGAPGADLWVCADPVHLAVRGDGLMLVPLRLTLTAEDEAGFRAVLAELFPAADAHAERGYVRRDGGADATFTPLAAARGRDLKPLMPAGPAGPQWRRRMTEAEMLLHAAPFNVARAARGAPVINGVWFWGAGHLPAKPVSGFTHVWSDEPLTRGLARHAGTAVAPMPTDAQGWLEQLTLGKHLGIVGGTEEPVATADSARVSLFRAAFQALARDRIGLLNIVAGERALALTPRDLYPWWRRLGSRQRPGGAPRP